MTRRCAAALVAALLTSVGCAEKPYVIEEAAVTPSPAGRSPSPAPTSAAPEITPTPAEDGDPLATMPLDPKFLARCRSERLLARACPTEVPLLEPSGFVRASIVQPMKDVTAFNFESSAPYPGLTKKNAPPRFAHVVVETGSIERLLGGFEWPASGGPKVTSPPPRRTLPLFVGRRRWGGTDGELALAAPYPNGGMDGDHLMFRWKAGGRDYIMSLHAWDDLAATELVLEQMFLSSAFAGGG